MSDIPYNKIDYLWRILVIHNKICLLHWYQRSLRPTSHCNYKSLHGDNHELTECDQIPCAGILADKLIKRFLFLFEGITFKLYAPNEQLHKDDTGTAPNENEKNSKEGFDVHDY